MGSEEGCLGSRMLVFRILLCEDQLDGSYNLSLIGLKLRQP